MLSVSNEFKNYLFDTVIDDKGIEKRKNSTIQWEYTVDIDGVGEYTGTKIKSINITGELQKEFTLGSSLSKSMDLDLLVSEKTPIKEDSSINVTLTLLIPIVDDKGYPVLDDNGKPTFNRENKVKLGTFYTTEVDRQTIGMLKIKAIDAMGHTSKLDSQVDMIFPDTWTTANQLVGGIAAALKLGFDPSKNPELYNHTVGTFKIVVPDFSYRQMLEYLAGFCGCNVRITNEEYIEFFRFEDTGITLKKAHYYNMSKGQYLFKPTALACTIGDTTPVIGEGKDSSTIKFTNPYMTEEQLRKLKPIFCDGDIEYYAINANIIGTGIFEPGDIVTIIDHYDEPQKIYIQDYKISCTNGVKETLDSHFEYNKGSIANSVSGKINQLSTSLKQYVSENFISTNEFDLIVKDINENIQYAEEGLNKWLIEYYKLEVDIDKEGNILDREYDLLAIKGKDYERCELIDDGPILNSTRLYDDSHTLCRYFTGVYIQDGDNLVKKVYVNVSNGVNVYINGTNVIKHADSSEEYEVILQSGWNTVELITGAKPNTLKALSISFKLKYEYAEEGAVDPFYHLTATMTQEEKDAEEEKKKEENNGGNENNTPTEPDTGGDDNTEGGENTGGGGTDEELNPASDDEVVEEDKKEELEVTYKRFDFIRLVNAYLIDINYKRVTEVERLTTADSIIDRVSKHTYTDAEGNEFTGGDLLLQGSKVEQTVNEINSTIEEYKKTAEGTEEKISEVTQTLDEYKISFTTAKYGNYFSNSSFGTDDPLTGFNYCLPTAKGKEDHVFTLRTDTEIAVGREPESVTVDRHDVANYGHLKYNVPVFNDGSFQGVVPNDDENALATSSRTLSMGQAFKISQTFFKEDEHFPYYKDNETGDYYQFYFSMKIKRSESCLYEIGDKLHVYPRLSVSLVIDHDPIIVGEEGHEEEITRTVINNLVGQPSENEGIVEYGELLDLDVLPHLRDYEIDTEWKMIEYFIDLPKERMDQIKVKSFSVIFETQYWPSVNKNYILQSKDGVKSIRDTEKVLIEEDHEPTIYICEPMFATTKDYLSVNYTSKQSEIITGVTNITQEGIQISRSDSELSTEIKNSGMAILYDGKMVAQFKEKTIIPELDVTKKLMAPNIFHNTTNIPDIVYIGEEFANDADCGKGKTAELCPKYVYFNHLNESLDRYGIVQIDKLTIYIKKNVDEKGNIKKVFPDNTSGTDTPNCFMLDNLRCGQIEIILEEGVVLSHPIVVKNIDGTVKIRGPIEKEWITLNTEYIVGSDENGPAPVVPNIIAHGVKWIEIWGLNFTGGRDFPLFNYRTGEYTDEKLFPGQVFNSYGELYTKKFDKLIFPFTSLYAHSTLEELNDIINKVAIFIGYCWCGDVSRCNFPSSSKTNSYFSGTTNHTLGVYGDHCDCYLFNNQGILGKYYLNRNKCWFRLPLESYKPQEDGNADIGINVPNEDIGNWGDDNGKPNSGVPNVPIILGGDGTTVIDLMDGVWPGGMIRKGKTDGKALDHCFEGVSRDLAYLGSFLYDSAPKGTFDSTISTLGSNLTGYSRVKQNVNLKGLKTLYGNTDGYFFGASPTLPAVSYSPEDISVASYTGIGEYKYTSLLNGLGLSLTMPDIAGALGESRELLGAKLKLQFETIGGKLVEYGNQNSFSNTSDNGISTYGGGVIATDNKGISFGVRFVYDESHYNASGELLKGYYNMGRCLRGHEILSSGRAINSWAICGLGAINSTQNFSHSGGMYGLSTPFVVGLNPFTNDGVLTTELEIDLGQVTSEWFDPNYIAQYTSQYMNIESGGYVDAESFFNTLTGLATSSIKYIDIVPVGIWDSMSAVSEYPSMEYYSHFSYDITGDQNAYIGLTTSCFKLVGAQLELDILTNEVPESPDVPKDIITIHYQDTDGNKIASDIELVHFIGETYDVSDYINEYYNYSYKESKGDPISGIFDDQKEITFIYNSIPGNVIVSVYFGTSIWTSRFGCYKIAVPLGEGYDVNHVIENPEKYNISIDENYYMDCVKGETSKDKVTNDYNIHIYVLYKEFKEYYLEVNFLRPTHDIIDDGYEGKELLERRKIAKTIRKPLKYGEEYDLVPYIDNNQLIVSDCIVDDFDGLEYEYYDFVTNYYVYNKDGISGRADHNINLFIEYRLPYEVEYGAHAPYAIYTGDYTDEYASNYKNRALSMGANGHAYVGVLSRTNPNTVNETLYYRHDDNYHNNDNQGGSETYGYINSEVERSTNEHVHPVYSGIVGNVTTGVEYLFNCEDMKDNFSNDNDIYLNIKFSKKSYGPVALMGGGPEGEEGSGANTDDLYYYISFVISKTRKIQGLSKTQLPEDSQYINLLHYGKSRIHIDNKDGRPSLLIFTHKISGSGLFGNRYDKTNNPILEPFVVTGCSPSSTDTHTQKIRLNDITFPKEWYDIIGDKYYSSDQNRADLIHPDIFTNVSELARRGMIVGVQVIPTNNYPSESSFVSYQEDPCSEQCLKILDIWLSKD